MPPGDSAKPAEGLSRWNALAGPTVLPLALPVTGRATATEPDPIFAAIERHRELSAEVTAAAAVSCMLLGPEFDAADAVTAEKHRALTNHTNDLICAIPTTPASLLAVMRYVASLKEWQTPNDQLWIWGDRREPARELVPGILEHHGGRDRGDDREERMSNIDERRNSPAGPPTKAALLF